MSVIINHFNLGMYYESYIVCPEAHRNYFSTVATYLNDALAVKSAIFCYDTQELTEDIKSTLKKTKNVLFVLTNGVVEKAAAEDYDSFRKVYGYIWNNNPDSISLMAVNNCRIGYEIEYPEDMVSFKWLHRKSYDLYKTSAEEMALELYNEFRLGYMKAERKKLERLAVDGAPGFIGIYYKGVRGMRGALLWEILSFIVVLVLMYTNLMDSEWMIPLTFLAAISAGVGLGYICYTLMSSLCERIQLLDVSVLFGDFKRRTMQRIGFLLGAGLWAGIWYAAIMILDKASGAELSMKVAFIGIYVILIGFTIVSLVRSSVLLNAAEFSSNYLELCEKRPRIHIIFSAVYAAVTILIIIAAAIYFK